MEASLNIRSSLLAIILAACLLTRPVRAQNCGCAADQCCSQYGYCGLGEAYCGEGCKEGPCTAAPATPTPTPTGDVSVADLVTADFFNGISNQAAGTCQGKSFYSRDAFINALGSFADFGKVGSADDSKREVAAFFAHVTHETGHFCYINEIDGATHDYCDETSTQWPCAGGKNYYGRGPLQLTWNYNYGAAGESLKFDGLGNPDSVASDPVLAFKTALWYWMQNVRPVVSQGFGATTRAINGAVECNGARPDLVQTRAYYYTDYCTKFGVAPGDNLSC